MTNNLPIQVHSHKRSGTHLLMATLLQNFEFPDVSLKALVRPNEKITVNKKTYIPGQRAILPWGKLQGNHSFYNPAWKINHKKILYIVRHPIPTLISHWRIMDAGCQGNSDAYISERCVIFWHQHTKSYTSHCFWIRYEDLINEKHDEVLKKIALQFNLTPKQPTFSRVKDHVGYYPNKEPLQSKLPTPGITKRFEKIFPNGVLGYNMTALNTYDPEFV